MPWLLVISLSIQGCILSGKIIGGFWWVLLGLLIGLAAGFVLWIAYKYLGGMFAALLPILVPTGAVLSLIFIDKKMVRCSVRRSGRWSRKFSY